MHNTMLIRRRYRPGAARRYAPPRRQQFDPEIAADLRPPATGPQSAHLWWPAVANGVVTCKIKKVLAA